ncbi:sulfate adenylyltransferase subunit 1 [Glutamicibacter arilaitensis]|uniref:sulfate adenylyltransferase n=3 Tax=Glutamicibacter arilaitensis TaxID=256701 RepID=A0A2N7S3N4_9MICC|nr:MULTISPECIES: GTP-binding protein [Glutamicibacter]PMQ20766.1 sulfate adenylyltransferase [Glutamicibacter arilaitensis]CBT76056.1 sulfate adenylyltransferase large subunit [Glutamicibacter arilaitensis Re117]HCH48228.1 sulfate adenylyltransferase [Glutamicibacter sp.]HCJ54479.1 sulfate adenylyltransferase [Glutamicibacter sp.]HCM95976.1 sulfate adenylyltransferase [Glutamicibacter sp.]
MTTTLLRIATAGSVDDGKSTLVGRLLHDAKAILADSLDDIARTSAERGFGGSDGSLDLALVTDGLRAEREQGITIDVAYRYFSTDKRSFILADCPGHVQYTRNTVTGASTADAAIVLVDARNGVLEQTRRHLGVLALLRVPQLVIAVNKMDLIDWDEAAFSQIESEVLVLAEELGLQSTTVIPVSALQGDNIVEPSATANWYAGPTLLGLLEDLAPVQPQGTARLDVQYVLRPQGALAPGLDPEEYRDYRGYAGTLVDGTLDVGDTVQVLSNGHPVSTRIKAISTPAGAAPQAQAGEAIVVELENDLDIARGDTLVAGELPGIQREFQANICVLDPVQLSKGQRVLIKHGTKVAAAKLADINYVIDVADYSHQQAQNLGLNDLGRITVRSSAAVAIDEYSVSRTGGSFLLIDPASGRTLAAGIIEAEHAAA